MRELPTHPGVSTVVGTGGPRRLTRLWELATGRHLDTDLLCLDNVDALITTIDEMLGPGQGSTLLEAVIRIMPAAGTSLLLTAPLVASTTRWAGSISLRLVPGATTDTQAALAGLPRGVVTDSAPGRGVILDGAAATACQIVLRAGFPVSASERDDARTLRLEPLPTRLAWEDVPEGTWAVGEDATAPVTLPAHTSVLVAGPSGSGHSTALRALAQAMASDPLVVDDLDLADVTTVTQVEAASARSEVALASASTEKVVTAFRSAISTMREREALVVPWPDMYPAD